MQTMSGVSQRSILGQKLFVLCINDICNISSHAKYILVADDTRILCSRNNIKNCAIPKTKFKELPIWFIVNKLSLSTEEQITWYSLTKRLISMMFRSKLIKS